ncbi:longevity-assurance protein [Coniophora puteana RWD-64-598 SS2]|uniref:Longevity-assurance protein n=1 Tax=Coniophora puteana (strain RWD-64-598) TaxID=741705 RepID=A0A5M3MUC0_CONPW|nr:longevity-assurance protein [Coniophora puteana RWD-64-598 SS2]EIW82364.1 longevity-assurance protein [Coniophora puteana RWD-64-598 SS2]
MDHFQTPEWLPSFLVPFVSLSHPTDAPTITDSFHDNAYYNTGILDGCLIISCIAIMAILRDATRIYILEPFARWVLIRDWRRRAQKNKSVTNGTANGANGSLSKIHNGNANGHSKTANGNGVHAPSRPSPKETRQINRSVVRFAEQGWSTIYYTLQACFGIYVHINLPTATWQTKYLWAEYPHVPLAGTVKLYYLTQTAFYSHQILILNAEAHRKDHVQMMTHHIITVILMVASYFSNFTRVGCLIMVLMDWCDIWLPLAKMLRYIRLFTLCDITFIFFLFSWFITRHYLFIRVILSAYYEAPGLIRGDWNPLIGHYYSPPTHQVFVLFLVSLQVIQVLWTWMISRVAWGVITGKNAEDSRSDDEGR